MAELIKDYHSAFPDSPAEIMLDAPVRNTQPFRRLISHLSGWRDFDKLKAQNKADSRYRHVGAASIIAKSIRDTYIRKVIFELNCDIGSGYSSDKLARNYVMTAEEGNPHIRWSWATCNNLRNQNSQNTEPLL
jgi:ribonuclease HII